MYTEDIQSSYSFWEHPHTIKVRQRRKRPHRLATIFKNTNVAYILCISKWLILRCKLFDLQLKKQLILMWAIFTSRITKDMLFFSIHIKQNLVFLDKKYDLKPNDITEYNRKVQHTCYCWLIHGAWCPPKV